ncbi:MAG: four helix bundle protein [Gemmataceae bacterium]|nr:four helix bundle protein [Gemmataceae bacterium]
MAVHNFRELLVWQRAVDLVVMVYRITEGFPWREMYGLADQVQRAAVSIPSNISEGQGRGPSRDFVRFLQYARGSLQEVMTQLLIAQRLEFAEADKVEDTLRSCDEIARLLNGLIRSVEARLG